YFYGDERRSVHTLLRELHGLDFRVCETELEAEVAELRLIAAHSPRHNRRSKRPRSQCWVKLTPEKYPRLSIARVLKDDGGLYLGPFRSKRAADLVLTGIWDAAPIRRCRGGAGKRRAGCAFAQLGVALCPCDGRLAEAEYSEVVERVRCGIELEPTLLLDPLALRMAAHAVEQRYEEAGWLRDRYQALARAIERRRAWLALQQAGGLWAENVNGEGALIERGRLVAAWSVGGQAPLLEPRPEDDSPQTPATVAEAEEAQLIWRWLQQPGVRVVDSTGPLALPRHPVPELSGLDVA
ncbi:MAG: endonuclease, partial [Gemmatimonadetes bacterium]|nr:endonuclease [Gemmatimonadota bacterium]NIY42891.1 endonuclease [Gemmatimonadota bacterium]